MKSCSIAISSGLSRPGIIDVRARRLRNTALSNANSPTRHFALKKKS